MTRRTQQILTIATLISLSHLATATSVPQFDPNWYFRRRRQGLGFWRTCPPGRIG